MHVLSLSAHTITLMVRLPAPVTTVANILRLLLLTLLVSVILLVTPSGVSVSISLLVLCEEPND